MHGLTLHFIAADVLCMTAQHWSVLLQGKRATSLKQNITEQPIHLACQSPLRNKCPTATNTWK